MQNMLGGIRNPNPRSGGKNWIRNWIRVKWMQIWNNDRWSSATFPLDTNIYWRCNVLPTCPGLSPPRMWASHILSLRKRALSFSSSTRSRGLLPLGTAANVTCFTPLLLFKSRSRWIFYYPDPNYLKVSVIFGFPYPDKDPRFYMYTDLHIFLMPTVLGRGSPTFWCGSGSGSADQ